MFALRLLLNFSLLTVPPANAMTTELILGDCHDHLTGPVPQQVIDDTVEVLQFISLSHPALLHAISRASDEGDVATLVLVAGGFVIPPPMLPKSRFRSNPLRKHFIAHVTDAKSILPDMWQRASKGGGSKLAENWVNNLSRIADRLDQASPGDKLMITQSTDASVLIHLSRSLFGSPLTNLRVVLKKLEDPRVKARVLMFLEANHPAASRLHERVHGLINANFNIVRLRDIFANIEAHLGADDPRRKIDVYQVSMRRNSPAPRPESPAVREFKSLYPQLAIQAPVTPDPGPEAFTHTPPRPRETIDSAEQLPDRRDGFPSHTTAFEIEAELRRALKMITEVQYRATTLNPPDIQWTRWANETNKDAAWTGKVLKQMEFLARQKSEILERLSREQDEMDTILDWLELEHRALRTPAAIERPGAKSTSSERLVLAGCLERIIPLRPLAESTSDALDLRTARIYEESTQVHRVTLALSRYLLDVTDEASLAELNEILENFAATVRPR